MKEWLKKNIFSLIGNFFIWIVPLIMALIMSFGGTQEKTSLSFKISVWGIVVVVIYLLVYYKKLRKVVDRQKTVQIAKLGYVKFWVRLVEWVSYLLPYVIALVLIVALKNNYESLYNDLLTFIVLTMISSTIGYSLLVLDIKGKKELN